MLIFDPSKKIHEQITEETWCKGEWARTADGDSIGPLDPLACKWCMYGWIRRAYSRIGPARNSLADVVGTPAIGDWNDDHTFAEVLAAFKAADL